MPFLEKIKSWPPKKKRNFSVFVAVILTLIIVGAWHWYDATYNNDNSTYKPDPFESLSGFFSDVGNEFRAASNQLASTTAFIKEQLASSTATSTATSAPQVASTTQKSAKKK